MEGPAGCRVTWTRSARFLTVVAGGGCLFCVRGLQSKLALLQVGIGATPAAAIALLELYQQWCKSAAGEVLNRQSKLHQQVDAAEAAAEQVVALARQSSQESAAASRQLDFVQRVSAQVEDVQVSMKIGLENALIAHTTIRDDAVH